MKTTPQNQTPPVHPEAIEKPGLSAAHQPDQFKERQKLPILPATLAIPAPACQVPANELEFANFYHL